MSASRPSRDATALGGREVTTDRRLRYPRGEARASVPEPPEDQKKRGERLDPLQGKRSPQLEGV